MKRSAKVWSKCHVVDWVRDCYYGFYFCPFPEKKSQNFMHHWFEIFTTTVRSSSLSTCSRLCIVALWGYKWVFWVFFLVFFNKISCLVNHNQYNAKVHLDTWNLLCVFGWSIHTYYMQTFFFTQLVRLNWLWVHVHVYIIYSIVSIIFMTHFSWISQPNGYPSPMNISPQQIMKLNFFFIIIFHKNVFTHKITCLLICQKNHVIYDNWSKRVTQYVPFWFLIHKHSPCTVIVLKHLTFSSPWWIVIITPYSNHWGVHPNYVTQIQIKIWSTFFYKKFLFFLKLGWMLQKDKVT